MAAFVVIVVGVVVWALISAASSTGSNTRLLRNGIPARGILLRVAALPQGSLGTGMYKLQRRQVTIDIEIPGQPPYEATTMVSIPLNLVRDVLPGATVEIRVDRRNPNNVAIVGPGVGFVGAALLTQGQINQGAA
jgi:hypothetical protein